MIRRLAVVGAVAFVTGALVGAASGAGGPGGTISQLPVGWDCNPQVLIFGYYHCAPPGKPSVADLIEGISVPSIVLRVFNPDGTFAGTEILLRGDIYAEQGCPQDSIPVWDGPLFGYRACHHFDT
jgi:hypothetical protein